MEGNSILRFNRATFVRMEVGHSRRLFTGSLFGDLPTQAIAQRIFESGFAPIGPTRNSLVEAGLAAGLLMAFLGPHLGRALLPAVGLGFGTHSSIRAGPKFGLLIGNAMDANILVVVVVVRIELDG
jgi:hypothetical protein